MKLAGRILSTTLVVLISFNMGACGKLNKNQVNMETKAIEKPINIEKVNLSRVTIIDKEKTLNKLFSIKNSTLQTLGSLDKANIEELVYDNHKGIYVFLLNLPFKDGKNKSVINIKNKSQDILLDNSMKYFDIKISKDSSKILFRSFKDSSLNVPEGIRVYDIEKNKEIKLNTEVLVSGDLYQWIDNENIIYYGIIPGKHKSGKIYKYNLKTGEESIYFDNFNGYCLNLNYISNGKLILLQNIDEEYKLGYYNIKTGKQKTISNNITDIKNVVRDKNKNILYFIGKSSDSENFALFSLNLKTLEILQLTYDLPKNVDIKAGLALDNKGNVIFAGTGEEKNNDIYIYDVENNSTNLITENPNNYRIYEDNEN